MFLSGKVNLAKTYPIKVDPNTATKVTTQAIVILFKKYLGKYLSVKILRKLSKTKFLGKTVGTGWIISAEVLKADVTIQKIGNKTNNTNRKKKNNKI